MEKGIGTLMPTKKYTKKVAKKTKKAAKKVKEQPRAKYAMKLVKARGLNKYISYSAIIRIIDSYNPSVTAPAARSLIDNIKCGLITQFMADSIGQKEMVNPI
jgi:c-di-AMP phosphodiesterase-like protein